MARWFLVLFLVVFVQPVFAGPDIFIDLPGSPVTFVLRTEKSGESKPGLGIFPKEQGQIPTTYWHSSGMPILVPYLPVGSSPEQYPHTTALHEKPTADVLRLPAFPVVIDKKVLILDAFGYVTTLPTLIDGASNAARLRVGYLPRLRALVLDYMSISGELTTYFYSAHGGIFKSDVNFPDLRQVGFDPEIGSLTYENKPISLDNWTTILPRVVGPDGNVIEYADLVAKLTKPKSQAAQSEKTAAKSSDGKKEEQKLISVDKITQLREAIAQKDRVLGEMRDRVFGQDKALERILFNWAEAKINGLKKPKVLVAMGPSGGGKTYSAQELAKIVADGAFLEVNGNEYNAHAGSLDYQKLLGSAAGVKGDQEGVLVEWLKKTKGRGLLLFNEGDKMHPDVWKRLMEFLDKGELSDRDGKTVRAEQLVIMITTNRGATRMFPATSAKWSEEEIAKRVAAFTQEEMRSYYTQREGLKDDFQLPNEVLNRVDEFVAFGPLTKTSALKIAEWRAKERMAYYKENYQLEIAFDAAVVEQIGLAEFSSSKDGRQINKQVNGVFAQILEGGIRQLELKANDVIQVRLVEDEKKKKQYEVTANGKMFRIAAQAEKASTPLRDPVLMERLRKLEATMKTIVVGQDEAIRATADAVVAHAGRGFNERPFVAMYIGPSGNGKTELGRALALARYGSAEKAGIIPMGNVSSPADFDMLFGSSAQYQGGDVERAFEKILRENPDGGVIIFDEFSNMGGNDIHMKTKLLMKLYDFFEQGRYISPMDGRVYELGKYAFVLTGNDLEEKFLGLTDDHLIEDSWKRTKDLEQVRALLREKGIPNALLNRVGVISLLRPLLKKDVAFVTEKLWKRQVDQFKAENTGLEVEAAPGFMEKVAKAFFSADQGGRAVRKVLEDRVGAVFMHALLNSEIDTSDLRGVKIVVDISDKDTNKAYRSSKSQPRQVSFTGVITKDGKVVGQFDRDVTAFAAKVLLQDPKGAMGTAIHEAGHAIVNNPAVTGERVAFVTIKGGQMGTLRYLGFAHYTKVNENSDGNFDREKTIQRIAQLMAGGIAQEMAGMPKDSGWSQDIKMARTISALYLTKWGLEPELIALPLDSAGNPSVTGPAAALFREKQKALMEEGEKLAIETLKANWRALRAVTAELLLKGNITGDRFDEIVAEVKARSAKLPNGDWTFDQYLSRAQNQGVTKKRLCREALATVPLKE